MRNTVNIHATLIAFRELHLRQKLENARNLLDFFFCTKLLVATCTREIQK